jgi:uncharacterized protein (TIGR03000 family)
MWRFSTWVMRLAVVASALTLGAASPSFAASHGGGHGGGGHGGGGHAAFHGGGRGGGFHASGRGGGFHAGGFNRGFAGGRGFNRGFAGGRGFNRGFAGGRGFNGGFNRGFAGFGRGFGRGYGGYGGWGGLGWPSYGWGGWGWPSFGWAWPSFGDLGDYGNSIYAPNYYETNPDLSGEGYPDLSATYAPQTRPTDVASLNVHVPENAQVWINGLPTTETGSWRSFASPPLALGENFHYDVRAQWPAANGQVVDQTRRVEVRPGGLSSVDFLQPQ